MPLRRLIPDVIGNQELVTFPSFASVGDVVRKMAERRIGAVPVVDAGTLVGIFTERDLSVRVVAAGLDPNTTPLSKVMTVNPDTLPDHARVRDALALMERRRYRHLPITDKDGVVIGVLSSRDLFGVVRNQLEDEIRERDSFMYDSAYSATAVNLQARAG